MSTCLDRYRGSFVIDGHVTFWIVGGFFTALVASGLGWGDAVRGLIVGLCVAAFVCVPYMLAIEGEACMDLPLRTELQLHLELSAIYCVVMLLLLQFG